MTVKIHDDGGTANGGVDTSVGQTFTITVTAVNDPPTFTKGADQSVLEDAGAQTVTGWATTLSAGPADESGQALSFIVTNDDNALFSAAPAIDSTGRLTYTTAPNANTGTGVCTVTVQIHDDGGTANGGADTSTAQTFWIVVTPVNDPPTFTPGPNITVLEDSGPQTFPGWATNMSVGPPDESAQHFSFTTQSSSGALFPNGVRVDESGTLTFTPAPNANGVATVEIYIVDDGGTNNGGAFYSGPFELTITVTPVNDAPSFTKGADQTVSLNAGAQSVDAWATNVSAGAADEVNQSLSFVITGSSNPSLFSVAPSVSPNGTLTYTPVAHTTGSSTITLYLHDDGGTTNGGSDTSATQSFTITVAFTNTAPVAADDVYSLPSSGTLTVSPNGVLANDLDTDTDMLSAQLSSAPAHGSVTLLADGSFTYVADLSFTGSDTTGRDTFQYVALDQTGSSSAPATITIVGISRIAPDSDSTAENTPVTTNVLANDAGVVFDPPPSTEVIYCYDGYNSTACSGSDDTGGTEAGRLSMVVDKPGNVTMTYDGAGRETAETRAFADGRSFTTSTQYDANGNVTSVTEPSGLTIVRTYDDANRETSISVNGTTLVSSIGWYPYGGASAWTAGAVSIAVTEDASGWVTNLSAVAGSDTPSIAYTYGEDGNVSHISENFGSSGDVAHDSLSRLTNDRGRAYTYDDAGNRLSDPDGAVAYPTSPNGDPDTDRWETAENGALAYTFDAAGNVLKRGGTTLSTADDGTVIGVSTTAGETAYVRDYRNLRLTRSGVAGAETWLHDAAGELTTRIGALTLVPCGGPDELQAVQPQEDYVYLRGKRVAVIQSQIVGPCGSETLSGAGPAVVGTEAAYFSDKMDLARFVYRTSDGLKLWSGDFDAWGNALAIDENPSGAGGFVQPFRLPGQMAVSDDEGGTLVENWNRLYDPAVGRFQAPDPNGTTSDPALYRYASDSPLR